MIGRTEPLRPLDTIRWARTAASVNHVSATTGAARRLRPLEAHLLVVLASYADNAGKAWPSIRTLAKDCALNPTREGRHSGVSRALAGLEELGLIWTDRGGRGRSSMRELLFNPSPRGDVPVPAQGRQTSPVGDPKYQEHPENGHPKQPKEKDQERRPQTGTYENGIDEDDREHVRSLILQSLSEAA